MNIFYPIKKEIVKSRLHKRQKECPPNLEKDDVLTLPKNADSTINNSYFFGGYSYKNKTALVMRLGQRNGGFNEVFAFFRTEKLFLVTTEDYYDYDKTPLKVECLETTKKWKVNFKGKLLNKRDNTLHDVEYEFIFTSSLPIYDFSSSYIADSMYKSVAHVKWNKEFLQNNQTNNNRHYEQPGWINGYIVIDGNKEILDMAAGRDRAFGRRIWDEMQDHIWIYGFTDKGEAINFCKVSYPFIKNLALGYTSINRNKIVPGNKAKINKYSYDGTGPDEAEFEFVTTDKEKIKVKTYRLDYHRTNYENGNFYFQEGVGIIDVNGIKCFGSIEFGFNKDKTRWGK